MKRDLLLFVVFVLAVSPAQIFAQKTLTLVSDATRDYVLNDQTLSLENRANGKLISETYPLKFENETGLTFIKFDYTGNVFPSLSNGPIRALVLYGLFGMLLYTKDHTEPFDQISAQKDLFRSKYIYSASSFLTEGSVEYRPENLGLTAIHPPWAAHGKGQVIEIQPRDKNGLIGGLVISNGFVSYEKAYLFAANNRVKKLEVISGSYSKVFDLLDTPNLQEISLGELLPSVTLKILDVYAGSKWNDTCINFVLPERDLSDASQRTKPTPSLAGAFKRAPSTEWARSVTEGKDDSIFKSVAVDGNVTGNVYAAGSVAGPDPYRFGPGVIVTPTASEPAVRGSNIQPTRDISATTAVLLMFDRDGVARWAVWPRSGRTADSLFSHVALDYSGNVVVSGGIGGVESYDYGNGIMLRGSRAYRYSAALVKYSREGKAQWARSISGPSSSFFSSVTVDTSQDIYVIGYCEGTGVFDFGDGVSVTVTTSGPPPEFGELTTPILVKYDLNGKPLWARCARTVETSSLQSRVDFNGAAIDAKGDVYVGGMLLADGSYDFGNGVNLVASSTGGLLLAKYSSDGKALWAITNQVPADQDSNKWRDITVLQAVALGLHGDVVVVGSVIPDGRGKGNRRLDFGHGVSATFAGKYPALIASYGADGTPLWAKTVGDSDTEAQYASVVAAPGGQFYVGGRISGTGSEFKLGDVKIALHPQGEALLIDYAADGKILWAKSAVSGYSSGYSAVSTDWAGTIFGLGSIQRTDTYDLGDGVSVAGTANVVREQLPLSNFLLTMYRIGRLP